MDIIAAVRAERHREIADHLGMPDSAVYVGHVVPARIFFPQFSRYDLYAFGLMVERVPDPPPWPFLQLLTDGDSNKPVFPTQCWWMASRHQGCPLYAELRWTPEGGSRIAIRGLEGEYRDRDLRLAARGIQLVKDVGTVGRPAYGPEPPPHIAAALREYLPKQRGSRRLSNDVVAGRIGIATSTWKDWKKRWPNFA